jgi:hypothetical protein
MFVAVDVVLNPAPRGERSHARSLSRVYGFSTRLPDIHPHPHV